MQLLLEPLSSALIGHAVPQHPLNAVRYWEGSGRGPEVWLLG